MAKRRAKRAPQTKAVRPPNAALAKEADRLVLDAMSRGWPRRAAEFIVKRHLKKITSVVEAVEKLASINALKGYKPRGRLVSDAYQIQSSPPRTAKERIERALGPDDGRPRRGGSPVLQGGSPGLGKRK